MPESGGYRAEKSRTQRSSELEESLVMIQVHLHISQLKKQARVSS